VFTGIIETVGKVKQIEPENSNVTFCIESEISNQLKVDQSVSHDGVCLTVIKVTGNMHWETAINETLEKSNLRSWKAGTLVNLERCMVANGRFDGHIVQGHVDQIGIIKSVTDERGSWMFEVEYNANLGNVTIEKGSVAVNGVSLTCFNSREGSFTVAIIPYTFEHTGFGKLKTGDSVNLEFDVIGKYVKRLLKH